MTKTSREIAQQFLALPVEALPAVTTDGEEGASEAWGLVRDLAAGRNPIERGTLATQIRLSADRAGYPQTISL